MSFEYSPVNSRLGLSPHLLEIGVPILGGLNYMARSELHLKHLEKVGASSEHLQNVLRDTSTKINLMAILQFGEIIAGSTLAMVGHSLYQLLSK